jgi:hypothetical protein
MPFSGCYPRFAWERHRSIQVREAWRGTNARTDIRLAEDFSACFEGVSKHEPSLLVEHTKRKAGQNECRNMCSTDSSGTFGTQKQTKHGAQRRANALYV